MKQPEDWAIELARKIYNTEYDNRSLDLMRPPWGFDAQTAVDVYDALEYLHEIDSKQHGWWRRFMEWLHA